LSDRIDVGVLGATGTVGVRLARLLREHPWFRLAEVGGSSESAGRELGDVLDGEAGEAGVVFSDEIRSFDLKYPGDQWDSPVLLSALPSSVAGQVETELARRGHLVVSNASSHRMDADVPLVIPEINPDHLDLVGEQKKRWPGAIVTNPNCTVVGLAIVLAPLHRKFGVSTVTATTMQALSGAGRPGPSAGTILGNIVPHIAGEEEKISSEPQKILGELGDGAISPAAFAVSPQTHRVPVIDGHLLAVSVKLLDEATPEEVAEALAGFEGAIAAGELPSVSERLIEVFEDESRPQPRLDCDRGAGMTVTVGRVRSCQVLDVKFSVLVNNLVRGAAGAALTNAELCHVRGLTDRIRPG
jgi:aspartate-semialdehyde dehydrogenase